MHQTSESRKIYVPVVIIGLSNFHVVFIFHIRLHVFYTALTL